MRVKIGMMWFCLPVVLTLAACSAQQTTVQPTVAPTTAPVQASPTASAKAAATTSPTTAPVAASPSAVAKAATSAPTAAASPSAVAKAAATTAAPGGTTATGSDTTPKIVAAANAFVATLNDAEKKTTLFEWTNTAQKQRWSNFPPAGFQRAGLMWGNMNAMQQNAWLAVMQATLSTEGYNRVVAEWNADEALLAQQGTGGGFGKNNYFIALIGTPSETSPWQWQWGGHHVTVNATIVGSNVALTPIFIGCQPCLYNDASGKAVRPLGDIEDEAFALVGALDATQKQAAIRGNSTIDLVLGPGQDGKAIQAEGLPAGQMNAEQQAALVKLISHYTGLVNDEDAAARNAEIKSALTQTYLAWYGPTTPGSAAYFRVTGPTIVIEYAMQRDGSHVHGIYRDPTNDYGAKYTK